MYKNCKLLWIGDRWLRCSERWLACVRFPACNGRPQASITPVPGDSPSSCSSRHCTLHGAHTRAGKTPTHVKKKTSKGLAKYCFQVIINQIDMINVSMGCGVFLVCINLLRKDYRVHSCLLRLSVSPVQKPESLL